MPRYEFDVKMYASVEVESPDLDSARRCLGNIMDAMQVSEHFVNGYNSVDPEVAKIIRVGLEAEEGDEPERIEPIG